MGNEATIETNDFNNVVVNEGHAKLATYMSKHTEYAILRRFGRLNILTLLYLQAELADLEVKLQDAMNEDWHNKDRHRYAMHWASLSEMHKENDNQKQWELLLKIRARLKEYNEHLTYQTTLSSLPPPQEVDLDFLLEWIERPGMGSRLIIGEDRNTWKEPYQRKDLLTLNARMNKDDFISRIISTKIIPVLHPWLPNRRRREEDETGVTYYSERRIIALVDMLSTFIASMLPISSITILYFVQDLLDRLAVSIAFTALFALCLTVTTKARRVEVFAATSAFAAVLVVFITGDEAGTRA